MVAPASLGVERLWSSSPDFDDNAIISVGHVMPAPLPVSTKMGLEAWPASGCHAGQSPSDARD